jgi:hypothetical protein
VKIGLIVLAGFLAAWVPAAQAFEVKGVRPGMGLPSAVSKQCEKSADVDSGVPGYVCKTTLGGYSATLSYGVHEQRVAFVIFKVRRGQMLPVLDALSERYGKPMKENPYIEEYDWSDAGEIMTMRQTIGGQGFSLAMMNRKLFQAARQASKAAASKDL